MNLEGKQQIWNDYQKEIADDRYYYARSCIRQTFFPGSEWAYLDILNNKLGKTVLDDPRHTTCTGIGYHSDVVPIEIKNSSHFPSGSTRVECGTPGRRWTRLPACSG